jgi:hypothetical protein
MLSSGRIHAGSKENPIQWYKERNSYSLLNEGIKLLESEMKRLP